VAAQGRAGQQLVSTVGAKNNPNETGYGANIWATYKRLYNPQ